MGEINNSAIVIPEALADRCLPLADLVPYARNAKLHTPEQVDLIARSIQKYGFNNPILIGADNQLIAGEGRTMAAAQLGMTEVPVIELGHLTKQLAREFILADNMASDAGDWDHEALGLEAVDLSEAGVDLADLGFGLAGFDDLIPGGSDADAETPAATEGDRAPHRQVSFTVHDVQIETVNKALAKAKEKPFRGPNKNANGNALHRMAAHYLRTAKK